LKRLDHAIFVAIVKSMLMFSQGEAKGFGFVLGRKKQRKEIWRHNHLKLPSSTTVFSAIDQRLGATFRLFNRQSNAVPR
jgi:hypothetical protein